MVRTPTRSTLFPTRRSSDLGIRDIGSGRLFIVKPYGLARYDEQTGQEPKFPLTGGVDVKYGLSSNLLLNLTDRKSTRLNSSHANISYAVFCLKKKHN